MHPKQATKTLKSSKAEVTGDPEMADATASNGEVWRLALAQFLVPLTKWIEGMQSDLKAVSVRVTEAGERISTNRDNVTSLKTQTNTMKAAIEELVSKVDDSENRDRRSNLHLVGLPEKVEGFDMCAFLETWIPGVLGEHNFPWPVLIERAHRIGGTGANDT